MFLPARAWVKLCVYLLYPLIIIGGFYLLSHKLMYRTIICMGFVCGLVTAVEIYMDYFIFGGIASKETNRLEYLKTSARGIPLLKSSLITDGVRRFFSTAIILAGSYLAVRCGCQTDGGYASLQLFMCILSTYLFAEAGLWITRFFVNGAVNMGVLCVLGSLAAIFGAFVPIWNIQIWVVFLLILADIGIAVIARRLILKRVEESYYDR